MTAEGRLLCIGDVHGCAPELERLLHALDLRGADRLVFLGDYVDRGESSAATLDLLLALRGAFPETVFLRGNHEEMLLGFLGMGGDRGDVFVRAGGAATLRSYGVDPDSAVAARELPERMPGGHLAFVREGLVLWHVAGPWAFVHAGVRPGIPLERQSTDDLLWIREEFLAADHRLVYTVVYGHTPDRRVQFSGLRRIGMDTGCVYGGHLSALDLTGGLLHQVRRGADTVEVRDVSADIERAR